MTTHTSKGKSIPKIAMLGLEGSGKTVLVTTLAKRFSIPEDGQIYISPQGLATLRYIEENWKILQSGQWPRSTYTGEMIDLTWKLHRPQGQPCEMRMVDTSGQVLRHLFSQDPKRRAERLPEHLATVERYCHNADIILLLLNIRDFIGEGDDDRHLANQTTLYSAIQQINVNDDKQVAVIFTQIDRYEALVQQYGGLNNFLKREVSYIYGDQIHGKPAMTMVLSAVNDTTTHIDQNGNAMLLPRPGFRSRGLDGLMRWLNSAIVTFEENLSNSEIYDVQDVEPQTRKKKPDAFSKNDRGGIEKKEETNSTDETIKVILGAIVMGYWIIRWIKGCS